MTAFYSATDHLASCLGSLPHASEWVTGQKLANPNTWNHSTLPTFKHLHDNLLTHYNCKEWAPPLADDAPAPDDYRYHIKKGLVLGKSLKIVRYQM